MKKRALYLILPVITLVLECLPFGAVCNFALDQGETVRKTFSYFDPVPFGYANFAPLLTAALTSALLVILAFFAVTGQGKWAAPAKTLCAIATVLSLGPLLYGISYFSPVGALITVTLAVETALLDFTEKRGKPQ